MERTVMKKTREERVADLLARDRELMARLASPTPEQEPAILRERTKIRSQMNLYGPAAVERLRRQDFEEFTDAVAEREQAREERFGDLRKKIRQRFAVG